MIEFASGNPILVTGANSGIGRAIALALNRLGAPVIANGRDEEKLASLKADASNPAMLHCEGLDLASDMNGLAGWMRNLVKKYGQLSGLVCSAGITMNSPLAFYPLKRVNQIFDICCHVPLILSGIFCNKKINSGPGSAIVHIAAAAAIDPNPGQGIYAAAKGALVAGAKCLAKEAAPGGIRVNCISPGLVETPMMEATCKQLGPDFLEREQKLYPLGTGKPGDVADLALFLLSSASRWITGQNILISGGR